MARFADVAKNSILGDGAHDEFGAIRGPIFGQGDVFSEFDVLAIELTAWCFDSDVVRVSGGIDAGEPQIYVAHVLKFGCDREIEFSDSEIGRLRQRKCLWYSGGQDGRSKCSSIGGRRSGFGLGGSGGREVETLDGIRHRTGGAAGTFKPIALAKRKERKGAGGK